MLAQLMLMAVLGSGVVWNVDITFHTPIEELGGPEKKETKSFAINGSRKIQLSENFNCKFDPVGNSEKGVYALPITCTAPNLRFVAGSSACITKYKALSFMRGYSVVTGRVQYGDENYGFEIIRYCSVNEDDKKKKDGNENE